MKKILFFGAMAAMLLGTASCSDENVMGEDGNVCFQIELPGALESRVISDGETAKALTVAVYDENGNELSALKKEVTMQDKHATVTFNLVRGKKYSFAFWAQAPDASCYTFSTATGEVAINYSGDCNDENRDAFYAYREPQVVDGTIHETIKLYRPFAQLNYIATDYAEGKAAGFDVDKSTVTVKNAATSFNLKTGEPGAETTEVTFAMANRPDEPVKFLQAPEGTTYTWMAMNYFIVPDNEAMIETSLTLNDGETPVVENMAVSNVPVKKNHRTNIIGAFMTTQAIFDIEVIPFYDEVDYDIINGELMLKSKMTVDEINYILKNRSGAYALAEDLTIDAPIVVPAGKTATLNLNGHNITNTTDIWNDDDWSMISVRGGDLTINGNGKVASKANDAYAIDVQNGGNLVINGGEYNGNITAVYVLKGHAQINGGKFSIQQLSSQGDYRFLLNLHDANRRNGTATIEVTGGEYNNFDPADNLAEGPNTNFVAAGYETVQNGDWYTVQPITPIEVSTEGELKTALTATGKKNIAVKLMNDMQLSYGARTVYGDASTKSITIDGNGHTLHLKGTDTDWSSFGALGGVSFILKNMTVYKTEGGNGAWNNHAINLSNRIAQGKDGINTGKFYLQNVTFNNAVCIQNDAEIENCNFIETGAYYVFYINASVKNIKINDCKFVASCSTGDKGRGIKVIDQYVNEADRVQCNINISNTSFESYKKAAILVTNTKGAKITASNLDISKVAADKVNAVWNDADRTAAYDLVEVVGCTKAQE